MRKLLSLPIFIFILFAAINTNAEITIEDSSSTEIEGFNVTQSVVSPGSGQENNYVVFACNTTTDGSNTFNTPVFGVPTGTTINQIDIGNCGNNSVCMMGIWSARLKNNNDANIICSWNDPRTVATAIGVTYGGVDLNNPIIDYACNTGSGNVRIAPSLEAEDNSQVIWVFTSGAFVDEIGVNTEDENIVQEGIGISRFASTETEQVGMSYDSTSVDAGPTGERMSISFANAEWRACTVLLRAQQPELIKPIPTVSEWGLMALAGVFGVLGFIALKRRKAAA